MSDVTESSTAERVLVEEAVSLTTMNDSRGDRPESLVSLVSEGSDGAMPAAALPPRSSAQPGTRPLRLWVRDLVFSIAASVFIITFLYQPVKVEGTSMLPRLEDQDRLFINKFVYRFQDIGRGDVVVFNYPRDPEKSYIKRVIALPGDRLTIEDGRVFVNGTLLKEPYVPRRYRDVRSLAEITLPPHRYFVMGDHRSISSDSRDFGPVDRFYIYGKAELVYWPTDQLGLVR